MELKHLKRSINYGRQLITQQDIDSVVDVLGSDFLTCGPVVAKFEKAFSKIVQSKYAAAVSNGTTALHLAYKVLELGPEDYLWTTPLTFAATANAAEYCGAKVAFVDVCSKTLLMDFDKLEVKLEQTDPSKLPKIVSVVSFAGYPVDFKKLVPLKEKYNFKIVEDGSHSPGAWVNNDEDLQQSGSCKYWDVATFSFHPVKHIACGEGGMVTTNSEKLHQKLLKLRSHATTVDGLDKDRPWLQMIHELGYNYRLADINAALGVSQLSRLKEGIKKRYSQVVKYYDALSGVGDIVMQKPSSKMQHAYHLFLINTSKRNELYKYLKPLNIHTMVHYTPVYSHPYYQKKYGYDPQDFPVTEKNFERTLSIPTFNGLEEDEQEFIIGHIKKFIG